MHDSHLSKGGNPIWYRSWIPVAIPALLFLIWVAEHVFFAFHIENHVMADGRSLIAVSEQWANGHFPGGRDILYLGYLFWLRVFGNDVTLMLGLQLILNGLMLWAVGDAASRLSRNRFAGYLAVAGCLLLYDLNRWAWLVQSDILMTEMTVFAFWALVRGFASPARKNRIWFWVLAGFFVVYAGICRPMGIATVGAGAVAAIVALLPQLRKGVGYALIAGVVVLGFVGLNIMLAQYGVITVLKLHEMGDIVFYYSQTPNPEFLNILTVEGVAPPLATEAHGLPVWQLLDYLTDQPIRSIKQILGKAFWFTAYFRPYYHGLHQFAIILVLLPAYVLAARTLIKRGTRRNALKTFTIALFTINLGLAILTCVTWDGRYLLPVLPIVMIWAGVNLPRIKN